MRALTLFSTLSVTPLLLAPLGCERDPRPPLFEPFERNVLEVARGQGNLTTFLDLLNTAGLSGALEAGVQVTVFAPTDAAFSSLPASTLEALGQDRAELSRVLRFHLVTGRRKVNLVRISDEMRTFLGTNMSVRLDGDDVIVGGGNGTEATVLAARDLEANNGIVHTIDRVLTPGDVVVGDLLGVAAARGYDRLVTAIGAAGLDGALSSTTATLFAPTDAAFDAITAPTDVGLLQNILLTHVLPGTVTSATLAATSTAAALSNYVLQVQQVGSELLVGGSTVTVADIPATNGLLHEVAKVIVPPTVLGAAAETPDLSTLAAAVGDASAAVAATLDGDGPITVFAPLNSAFAAIPATVLNAVRGNRTLLDNILTYHVVPQQVLSSGLSDGQMITMANGENVTVMQDSQGTALVDARGNTVNVVATDLRLANGVVHLIDGVLFPAEGTLLSEATLNGFTLLPGVVAGAGLDGALAGSGPFTLFAPTDAAVLAFNAGNVDPDVIANVLLAHVVPGDQDSTAVLLATSLPTLANLELDVETNVTPPTFGGASLDPDRLDFVASNGRIHTLDDVIIPPTIVDVVTSTVDLTELAEGVARASPGVQEALNPDTLNGGMPITVFAPTNQAFDEAGIDTSVTPVATLDAVLAHHVVIGQTLSSTLSDGRVLETLNGPLTVNVDGDVITLIDGMGNTSTISDTVDVRTLSGVVHKIEGVLMPAP